MQDATVDTPHLGYCSLPVYSFVLCTFTETLPAGLYSILVKQVLNTSEFVKFNHQKTVKKLESLFFNFPYLA